MLSVEAFPRDALGAALRRLDERLAGALDAFVERGNDPFRGLYIAEQDVRETLASRGPELPQGEKLGAAGLPRLMDVATAFGLDDFELDVLLLALAPELDLRYERVYAYLQDDVTRRRPCVDLALGLLCATLPDRLARRGSLGPHGALARHGLVHLADPDRPLLSRALAPDETVVRAVLGDDRVDPRLDGCASLVAQPQEDGLPPQTLDALTATGAPLRLAFAGREGSGRGQAAGALARRLGRPLLVCDAARADEPTETVALARREAALRDAVFYVAHAPDPEAVLRPPVPRVVVAGTTEPLAGALSIPFALPQFAARRAAWSRALRGGRAPARAVTDVAARFELGLGQIEAAGAAARVGARLRNERVRREDVFAAARAQSRTALGDLARRIDPRRTWRDLVLPAGQVDELRQLCGRVAGRHRVLHDWGFAERLSQGTGITALFSGGSGTGKTLAAEVVARELGLELYRIDLSGVVSKYIGETEKNLARVFAAAEGANAILLFDEADALFGKRSEVHDSHDRYANIEISYLLQKMEEYEGVAILATNLRDNLDEAFARRLAFTIPFPFPEVEQRREIWRRIWPRATPLHDDLDVEQLAARFALSGGEIKNVALAAAYLAADDGGAVATEHVLQAVRTEYRKVGRSLATEPVAEAA